MTLYERIYNLCKERNMTGKELGEMLGLKKSPLTDWKNKKANPTVEQVIRMCEIFATSSEYILFGKESKNLSEEEEQIIKAYRKADERTKNIIRLSLEPYNESAKSSNSKTG